MELFLLYDIYMRFLIDADPGVKSKAGFTPLHMAAQEGHEDCVEMLIERGADVNVPANNG